MPPDRLSFPQPPSALFGELFERVQLEGLFGDSKAFPDMAPLETPEFILDQYRRAGRLDREQLRQFINKHFERPPKVAVSEPNVEKGVTNRIGELWSALLRHPAAAPPHSSLIETGHTYVVPGGRFAEAYYWDTYFSILGLVASGHQAKAGDITRGFAALIERFGFVPNGTRSYYLSRSQPPLFYKMVELTGDDETAPEDLALLIKEHGYWMSGSGGLIPGQAHRRVVSLPDGSILNRYWDDLAAPRDESFLADRSLADRSHRVAGDLYRDLRAAAESGWDFSSRWLDDPLDLATIRTTSILPVDLNAFLWGLEIAIQNRSLALGEHGVAQKFAEHAHQRANAMRRWLWEPRDQFFGDYDWERGAVRCAPTAALVTPLFVGLASPSEAASAALVLRARLLRAGGIIATEVASSQQWDAPNGWAPLQWIAVIGLAQYGHEALALTIADRWLSMVDAVFTHTGQFFEKYDVDRLTGGGGGEYAPQYGFGWTNGVTSALMKWRLDSRPAERERRSGTGATLAARARL